MNCIRMLKNQNLLWCFFNGKKCFCGVFIFCCFCFLRGCMKWLCSQVLSQFLLPFRTVLTFNKLSVNFCRFSQAYNCCVLFRIEWKWFHIVYHAWLFWNEAKWQRKYEKKCIFLIPWCHGIMMSFSVTIRLLVVRIFRHYLNYFVVVFVIFLIIFITLHWLCFLKKFSKAK